MLFELWSQWQLMISHNKSNWSLDLLLKFKQFNKNTAVTTRNYRQFLHSSSIFTGLTVIVQTNIIIRVIFDALLWILCSQQLPEVWNPLTKCLVSFLPLPGLQLLLVCGSLSTQFCSQQVKSSSTGLWNFKSFHLIALRSFWVALQYILDPTMGLYWEVLSHRFSSKCNVALCNSEFILQLISAPPHQSHPQYTPGPENPLAIMTMK